MSITFKKNRKVAGTAADVGSTPTIETTTATVAPEATTAPVGPNQASAGPAPSDVAQYSNVTIVHATSKRSSKKTGKKQNLAASTTVVTVGTDDAAATTTTTDVVLTAGATGQVVEIQSESTTVVVSAIAQSTPTHTDALGAIPSIDRDDEEDIIVMERCPDPRGSAQQPLSNGNAALPPTAVAGAPLSAVAAPYFPRFLEQHHHHHGHHHHHHHHHNNGHHQGHAHHHNLQFAPHHGHHHHHLHFHHHGHHHGHHHHGHHHGHHHHVTVHVGQRPSPPPPNYGYAPPPPPGAFFGSMPPPPMDEAGMHRYYEKMARETHRRLMAEDNGDCEFETDPEAYDEDDGNIFGLEDDELDSDEEAWVLEQMMMQDDIKQLSN